MSLIISCYRSNTMENLPWRLLKVKGIVSLMELILFDMNEYPSFTMTSYVRDDFIMVSAYIFYMFNLEGVPTDHPETL